MTEQKAEDYPEELSFEEELEKAKLAAVDYEPFVSGTFREMISDSCLEAYEGLRSIGGFVKFATALVKDEDGYFAKYNISAQILFINSLKSQDIDLEILREENSTDPEDKELFKKQSDNLNAMISELVKSGALSSGDCKMHFSSQLLKDANIIPNKILFDRRLVRLNTAMLYKQHKFNLTRENSEGYAGLIDNLTYTSIDNEKDSQGKLKPIPLERVPDLLKTISSHIGAFHLDPNRVLDIILDFFIKQLTINYQFWIELLKQSGWIQKFANNDQSTEHVNSSPIMAQLIGFRFYNYHYEKVVAAPKALYLATAILLKNGLILLGDVLPHMAPFESDMTKEREKYMSNMNKEITSNTGGMLAMFGALGEEGATQKVKRTPTSSQESEATPEKKYGANDVVELTKALLSVGDLYHVQTVLAKYDKLCDLYPQLANDIYRICRVILQPAYELFVPEKTKKLFKHFAQCAERSEFKVALSTIDNPNPDIPEQIKLKRVLVTDALLNGTRDLVKQERYVFFYKEWADNLDLCEAPEHLTTRFMPLMRLAGYRTYLATDLTQKLLHITVGLLDRATEFPNSRIHCINMLREFLIPAVSFSKGNPGTMADVWDVVSRLSFQERYCLYGEWSTDFYKKNIETKLLKARLERAVKFVMRRVSKNDVRQCGRDLGKLAHSNPTIVFNIILDQVQSFDNMAPLMADACRYLGDFSYDVLGFMMTEKWTGSLGPGKGKRIKEKEDGIPATWLRALSVFSGMLFKKQDIDPLPLLRYMVYRLRKKDAVQDLVLLNEFITKMGGIEIIAGAHTEDQITAAGCAEALRGEAFLPISVDNRRASRRVLSRLKDALRKNNTAFEILALLYVLGESVLVEPNVYADVRCSRLDRVHQTQLQYFELLTSLFEGEEYDALVPNADVLVNDYNLPLDTAMNFVRPKTQYAIKAKIDTPIVEGECWAPVQPLAEVIPTLMPDPTIDSVFSAEFYTYFWQLSLYDIYCPVAHYENAIKRHTDMIRQCQDTRSSFYQSNRPSVVNKAERQAQASLEIIKEELPKHKAHVEKILSVLKESQQRWFPSTVKRVALISHVMQYCLLPRSDQSEVDAAFCYEFVMLMHRLGVKNFSSLTLFDKVLSENLPAVFSSFTEYETTIHARFIFKTLSKMSSWHADERLYLKEAHGEGLIGFQKNWSAQPNQAGGQEIAKEDLLSYSEFKRVLHKWHFKACGAIEQALNSGEAHLITNAFLVLRQFIPCFPMVSQHGDSIIKIVDKLGKLDNRGNIKVLARSYLGLIEKNKSKWVSRNVFLGTEKESESSTSRTSSSSQPTTVSLEKKSSSTSNSNNNEENKESSTSNSSGNHHSSSTTSSSRHASSSSKTTSPTRRSESKSVSTAESTADRKRPRDTEPLSREKSQRLDETGSSSRYKSSSSSTTAAAATSSSSNNNTSSSNGNNTTSAAGSSLTANNTSSSSSSRHSPRESSSRTGTPHRDPTRVRDPAREAIREAARENARETSTRSSKESSSTRTTAPASTSSRSATTRDTTTTRDERSTRTSTTTRTSSSAASSPSESRKDDDRRAASSSATARSSSASRATKRTLDIDRDRERERPEKRRDHREERGSRGEERTREDRPKEATRTEDRTREERPRDDRAREDRVREERAREDRARDDRLREDRMREERARDDRLRDDRRDDRMRDRRVDDRRARERDDHRRRRR
ncbi:hypothetical protein K501DRAFT_285239 [Backusella circina FSU 941]|nr:hypothetical protein K501DRAFT_285239 [Backusella circina FSU 941]